jgi:hypothetical protein
VHNIDALNYENHEIIVVIALNPTRTYNWTNSNPLCGMTLCKKQYDFDSQPHMLSNTHQRPHYQQCYVELINGYKEEKKRI